jgi:WD40 repeat protein
LSGLPPQAQDLVAVPAKKAIACLVGGLSHLLDERTLREVRGPVAGTVTGVSPSPSGTTFVGQRDGRLHLHDLAGGEHLGVLPGSEGTAWDDGLVFSPDGRLVVCVVSGTRRLKVWDVARGRLEADLVVSKALNTVAFHPDGQSLAVVAEDQTFLYELNGGGGHAVVAQHAAAVRDLAVSADGRTLATLAEARPAGAENVLALWPLGGRLPVSPSFRWEMRGPARDFHTLALHPCGSAVCYTSEKKVLCREAPGGRTYPCGSFDPELKRLCFAPNGILWAAAGHEIRCGPVSTGHPRERVALPVCFRNEFSARDGGSVFYSVAAGRRRALAGRRDGKVFLFDAAERRHCAPWQVCTSPIWSVALGPDERQALVGTELGKLRLLSLPTGKVVKDFPVHGDCVTGVAFAGAGLLVSASRDGTVRLWRPDGQQLLTLEAPGPVRKISVGPDGSKLALVVEGERAVRLWHLDRLAAQLADLGLPLNLSHLK